MEFYFKKDDRLSSHREKRFMFGLPQTSHSIDTTNASFNAMLAARAQDMIDQLGRPQTTDTGRVCLHQLAENSDGASVNLAMSGEFNESAASATLEHA